MAQQNTHHTEQIKQSQQQDLIVEMRQICKSFDAAQVLHQVDFYLKKGAVHALLGENGTGKTTLMNILGGVIKKDSGEIKIEGNPQEIISPQNATELGIAFIHQELTLVNDMRVFENLFLGVETKKGMILDQKTMQLAARQVIDKIGVAIDCNAYVRDLNASYKQIVEIARALLKQAKIIIMDEPTASLAEMEIHHIFKMVRSLKQQGVSFIFISHKLNEVVELCDSYTIMRDGTVVDRSDTMDGVTERYLAKQMIGKEMADTRLYTTRDISREVYRLDQLTARPHYNNINLSLYKGEILGVTGLLGDGRSELFETVCGYRQPDSGTIYVNGKQMKRYSTAKAKQEGIAYLPRNRKENGIIKDLSISHNMSITILEKLRRFGWIDTKKETASNQYYLQKFNIKAQHMNQTVTSLSGGNQQKVVLARALASNPQIVILDNPTQGVDIGAKFEIYTIIMQLAAKGISFVVLSSEANEILLLCDRVYVMYQGEIKKELSRADANQENLMIYATGGDTATTGKDGGHHVSEA